MFEKTYQPAKIESKHYDLWESSKSFSAGRRPDQESYAIVIPPPNVTGSLHMGHALNNTLQDVLIRYKRMRGLDVLWQPGTDHAGIATQMVVERQLSDKGIELERRIDNIETDNPKLGRAEFLEKVWEWKEESGGTIIEQLKRLGSSCDWSRERFTMDEGLSKAVLKVFVDLYKKGLIYKDQRLVNWDPKLHTAVSDLEVVQKSIDGNLWYFRYPIEDQPDRFVTVATTRPETMLGDTGVAVHPDDKRYFDLVGKNVVLPLVGRTIKIVADEYADPEQGSGAVKITPAHDFNDFEVGRRHNLEQINIFDASGRINDNAPEIYRGMDRFEARKRIVSDIDALGLLEKIDAYEHTVPYGDRSDVVIEPWLTDQWYVDAATLAKPAIEAVEQGKTKFVPESWSKTYFEWLRNIQPWCISRQLWWGHQIPAWYGPEGEIYVELNEEDALEAAKTKYGKYVSLVRDEDVLDTWFSSALWPFSTLGWPENTPELTRYYPTDVLVTGFDIIFFWVARMMMMGLEFMGEVPFHTVYIHALVRDEKGQKMSKSKGNVIDPLELVDEYGADALRFTLTAMAAMGRDIKLSEQRVAGYRNFGTKLWNASRFCEINGCVLSNESFDPLSCDLTINKWIIAEVSKTAQLTTNSLEAYKFDQAANSLYHFVWHTFCDWYLEFAKSVLQGDTEQDKLETRTTTAWVLNIILRLLHPIMPFITEELWEHFGNGELLITSDWPEDLLFHYDSAASEMEWVIDLITEIRTVRSELNVPPAAKVPVYMVDLNDKHLDELNKNLNQITRLANLETAVTLVSDQDNSEFVAKECVQFVIQEATAFVNVSGLIDFSQEKERLRKEIDKHELNIASLDKKLSDDNFMSKAPENVIELQKERRSVSEVARKKLMKALSRISN
ncbi:MAG: valine--tRNA ligase [Alphaproteobacteria bacterium]|jgi:valyl-tRNA synthetase|nr:valine--tRNA ligase [Alphaproteobacteria bacterium]PPR13355.1 MAG: Valine--tRNA ligase [Alphaproteobacteria bacterium MarineAlpha12_Bin1]|tara:strand:+ start:3928 stop:6621 length:2694 start_codon:yes stop_codon:yes gene_type:complete